MANNMIAMEYSFVEVVVERKCSKCHENKVQETDFYNCSGKYRSECKQCTIKKNVDYQRKIRTWDHRYVDNDEKRSYMVEYYAKNKEKFAEYRKQFRKRYPGYHTEYARNRKNEGK